MLLFRSVKFLFITYLLLVVVFGGLSYSIYQNDKNNVLEEQSADLKTTAKLKKDLIEGWYNDRLSDSQILSNQNLIQSQIISLLISAKKEDYGQIKDILTGIFNKNDYYNILILDHNEKLIFKLFKNRSAEYLKDSLEKSVKNKNIVFSNIYLDPKSNQPFIDIYSPLYTKNNYSFSLIIKIDPQINLYPLVSSWYKKNSTGESFLISKYLKSLHYISPLKYKTNVKSSFKDTLDKDSFVRNIVINNSKGLGRYLDYRGKIVLADVRPLINLPWYLVTKMDMSEIYKPVSNNTLRNLINLSLIIFLGGILLIYFYTKSNLNNLKKLNEAENKFKSIFDNSTDASFNY